MHDDVLCEGRDFIHHTSHESSRATEMLQLQISAAYVTFSNGNPPIQKVDRSGLVVVLLYEYSSTAEKATLFIQCVQATRAKPYLL